MKLLITKSTPTAFYEIDTNKQVNRLYFPNYFDQDLCPPSQTTISMKLPWELTSNILGCLFKIYLETFNFDLACDLLMVKKDFIKQVYQSIYGRSTVHYFEKYRRLSNTLYILSEIHDTYVTVLAQRDFCILKLVRTGDPMVNTDLNPWDFTFDFFIEPLSGFVSKPGTKIELHNVGIAYGNQVWTTGKWRDGVFFCDKINTPIINLKFTNIYEVIQHTASNINNRFVRFFELVRETYGPLCAINVMIQPQDDINPFVSNSNSFISF